MSEYNFKRISTERYKDVAILYLKTFGVKLSLDEIRNKFDTDQFGLSHIGYIAYNREGDPSAYYGVFPIVMTTGSIDYLVAQSGDTMTAPEHQRKGLFTQLAKYTYQLAKKEQVKLIFGFPNKYSYPGFKHKLDWDFTGHMQIFEISNFSIPTSELIYKYGYLRSWYKNKCKQILSPHLIDLADKNISCFSHVSENSNIKKNRTFFEYKINTGNCFLLKIDKFTLLVKPHSHLLIGDVAWFDITQTASFIKTLKSLGRKLNSMKTVLSLSENHWLFTYLIDYGLQAKQSLHIGFLSIDHSVSYNSMEFIRADYDTF
ncbi:MAG: GNAT family N-acetyltransferase [Mariniphaga sp.]|nr:GNAT family N-acetyltransferase [Mariniphaga sp.]